jgi:hypothetical protein
MAVRCGGSPRLGPAHPGRDRASTRQFTAGIIRPAGDRHLAAAGTQADLAHLDEVYFARLRIKTPNLAIEALRRLVQQTAPHHPANVVRQQSHPTG